MEDKVVIMTPDSKGEKLLRLPNELEALTVEMYEELYERLESIKLECVKSNLTLFDFEDMLLNKADLYLVRVEEHLLKIKDYWLSPDGLHWSSLKEFKDGRKKPFTVGNLKKSGIVTSPKIDPENTIYIESKNNNSMKALLESVFSNFYEAEIAAVFISSVNDGYTPTQTINFIQRYYRKADPQISQNIPNAIAAINIILNKNYHVDVDTDSFKRGTLDRIINQLDIISKLIHDSRYQWTDEELDEIRQGIVETYANLPEEE